MGNKKTTKNLLYLFGVVVIIAIVLLVYGGYANKAQAPAGEVSEASVDEPITAESTDLTDIDGEINKVDDLNTDELDSIKEDIDSIDLNGI